MPERSLKDLDGRIARFRNPGADTSDGVVFTCPSCPPERRHSIAVSWAGPSIVGSGHVWNLESASDLSVLTLSPSINCDVPYTLSEKLSEEEKRVQEANRCRFHGWVRGGIVQW